jgi:acyl carrier protein
MTRAQIFLEVNKLIAELAHSKGLPTPTIKESTELLGGDLPIDSLDLAGIIVQLDSVTGCDPFREGFIDFRTVGELARLYER